MRLRCICWVYVGGDDARAQAGHARRRQPGVQAKHMAGWVATCRFEGYVISYQERSFKPEEAIYRAVERLTGLQGEQLLFIDDKVNKRRALPSASIGFTKGWALLEVMRG